MTKPIDPTGLEAARDAVAGLELNRASDYEIAEAAIRAYLASRSAPEAGKPVMKPLEWKDRPPRSLAAKSILGPYTVSEGFMTQVYALPPAWIGPNGDHHEVETVEAAKAAAQADYEQRIRSALVQP